MKSKSPLLLLFVVGLCLSSVAQRPASQTPEFLTDKNVPVRMRDGVILRADVLRPRNGGPFPALVYRTPYSKESALRDYTTFRRAVKRGYAVVVQDVRGRYASGGEFRPYQNEGHDGYDTIEWTARQPWSNGAVGTFGLSYPGAVQWLAAVESPPHLKAMVPAMTFSTPQNFFYAGGVWDLSWISWIWQNIAPDLRAKKNLPGPKTSDQAEAAWAQVGFTMESKLPLSEVEALREVAPYYFDWLSHPPDDPWWDWAELHGKYGRVHAAVLNFSGWYDDNYGPEGATTNFLGLQKSRNGRGDPGNHLLIGPWVHGVAQTALTKSGEREFGSAAAIDYDEVILRWMDHYLRGINNGVENEKPVRYFVMGENQWRDSDTWPPVARSTAYYLVPAKWSETHGALSNETPTGRASFVSFLSDPANPVVNTYATSGAHDYRELAKRHDVLVFDSVPLERDTEVTGPVRARIYVSCACKDLDLWVRLLDVAPDGSAYNLMGPGLDVQRLSYRDPKLGRQLLTPYQTYEVKLYNLITSNVFQKGHRIRVQISGSFFPNFSRNLQTGELETVSGKTHRASVFIYADSKEPSQIILPVVEH